MNSSDKRQQILKAAVAIMARKGKDATIAEIATAAQVTDSIIYHYFKNKEDLLFHSAGEHLRGGIALLREQLQGIQDPVSRLRKLIWFQLYYHDKNPHYTNFTIFECRSKKNFFSHKAFNYFRQWTRILKEIIEDGGKAGVFSADLNITVVRDAIFGLLDMENIQCMTGHHDGEAHTDLDDIMDLILPMITRTTPQSTLSNDKSRRIIAAAETVFARQGYDRARILEISRSAGVAEGTVYEYFKNKEELLYSVLHCRFQEHLASLDELFDIKTPVRKLRRFIRYHFSLYLNQPSFVKTFILNGIYNRRFYASLPYRDFRRYLDTLDAIMDGGKSSGSFNPRINNRIFKNLFIGAFSHMALRWLYVDHGTQIDKTREINAAIDLLNRAAVRQEPVV